MVMFTVKALFAVAAASILAVNAQSGSASAAVPTSTAGIDPCLITCVTGAITTAGCSSLEDLTCICTSTSFQSDALSCLQSNCPASDLAAAQALQSEECGTASSASGSASASPASTTSSAALSGSSSISSSSAPASSTPSSAARSVMSFRVGGIFSSVMAVTGVAFGAFIV
ncbi:hypothetical protein EW145_g1782 [Phellinidium pouzarii]|uniref:CFEM domain-containing protein n=1 Tax=Phellinidium pouzarii TaxID=167371 RepID=A0A4S4LDQ3_9AGAM|nr:hypothetical protein EW145_g1782 [Phellinidium pouzarii]